MTKAIAPLPWSVDRNSANREWTNSCSIIDANGGEVCVLTRGYQGEMIDGDMEGCPSWDNAEMIVAAVNAYAQSKKIRVPEHCQTCGMTDTEYSHTARICSDPWHADDHLRRTSSGTNGVQFSGNGSQSSTQTPFDGQNDLPPYTPETEHDIG